jgi:hypothetical protein
MPVGVWRSVTFVRWFGTGLTRTGMTSGCRQTDCCRAPTNVNAIARRTYGAAGNVVVLMSTGTTSFVAGGALNCAPGVLHVEEIIGARVTQAIRLIP